MALIRPHHPLKTLDEVTSSIPGATAFSFLDAKSAFWHIKLDKQSIYYTTFNSMFGRYRYLRMPYGIFSGSEVYQQAIESLMECTPCKVIADDILVYGTNVADHDANLKIVLKLLHINLRLNVNKRKFRIPEVKYVGNVFTFTSNGLLPGPDKVSAINDMSAPEDKTGLQWFLGMASYLSRYVENYSDKTSVVRELLHDDVSCHDQAFQNLKNNLCKPRVLAYYDVHKPVTLACDSSKSGLGAAILQDQRPIAYASRALTNNEAQIEKEMASIVFAYTENGKTVTVETDHKPLECIFKKPISKAPARLQNMLLKLQIYSLVIVFKKGSKI